MRDVAFLVPLSTTLDIERRAAWYAVRARLHHLTDEWPIITGRCDTDAWSKGCAVDAARQLTRAAVLVIHDADVFVAPHAYLDAVNAVRDGAAWAVPHGEVYRLDAASTTAFYAGALERPRLTRPPYLGYAGGGITVVARSVWDECPIDPRFVGWGSEDQAWGWALQCLYGPAWRGDAVLTHLWHPHAAPGRQRNDECHDLWRAYRQHRSRPDLMRDILAQARAAIDEALPSADAVRGPSTGQ